MGFWFPVEEAAEGLAGRTIQDVFPPNGGLQVMGIERAAGCVQIGPRGDTTIERGDRLMVYGDSDAMDQLSQRASQAVHPR